MLRRGQPDSGESCNVLQSRLTRSLVALFPQHSVIACSMRILCCRGRTLRMRPQTGVCKLDDMAPKAHQDNQSSADLPLDSLCKVLAWWAVPWKTSKNHKTWGVGAGAGMGACTGMGACAGMALSLDNMVHTPTSKVFGAHNTISCGIITCRHWQSKLIWCPLA